MTAIASTRTMTGMRPGNRARTMVETLGIAKERSMVRKRGIPRLAIPMAAVGILLAISIGVAAQGGPPPADAPPGDVGFQGAVLGGIDPVAAPGYRLVLAESVFEPGAYVTSHFHPTAIVVCV